MLPSRRNSIRSMHSQVLQPTLVNITLEDQVYADPIKKLQEEMLQQLYVLREGLYQTLDVSCSHAATGATAPVAPVVAAVAESDSTSAAEIKKLKDENTKLNYRIKILCKTLDESSQKK